MDKIRELFHKVGNCHNKITIGTGVARIELTRRFKDKRLPPEIKEAVSKLAELEKRAVEASRILNQLKDIIYKRRGFNARRKETQKWPAGK